WMAWKILQVPQVSLSGATFPLSSTSAEPLVAAVPAAKSTVLASATHTLVGPTMVRQFGSGAAIDIGEIAAGSRVRLRQTRGEWGLVARDGAAVGYVERKNLTPLTNSGNR